MIWFLWLSTLFSSHPFTMGIYLYDSGLGFLWSKYLWVRSGSICRLTHGAPYGWLRENLLKAVTGTFHQEIVDICLLLILYIYKDWKLKVHMIYTACHVKHCPTNQVDCQKNPIYPISYCDTWWHHRASLGPTEPDQVWQHTLSRSFQVGIRTYHLFKASSALASESISCMSGAIWCGDQQFPWWWRPSYVTCDIPKCHKCWDKQISLVHHGFTPFFLYNGHRKLYISNLKLQFELLRTSKVRKKNKALVQNIASFLIHLVILMRLNPQIVSLYKYYLILSTHCTKNCGKRGRIE